MKKYFNKNETKQLQRNKLKKYSANKVNSSFLSLTSDDEYFLKFKI